MSPENGAEEPAEDDRGRGRRRASRPTPPPSPPMAPISPATVDGREGDQAADRQVDPAGDDHHRHADGDDRDHRDLVGDVAQVVRQEEGRPAVGRRDDDRHGRERGERLEDRSRRSARTTRGVAIATAPSVRRRREPRHRLLHVRRDPRSTVPTTGVPCAREAVAAIRCAKRRVLLAGPRDDADGARRAADADP